MSEDIAEALVEEIPRLRRYARALTRDSIQADDLVQDCLERAWSRIDRWQPGTNLRAWLFTILHNIYVSGAQRNASRGIAVTLDAIDGRLITQPIQIEHMKLRDLSRSLKKISAEERLVVLLVGLEGMSYESAAETLKVPVGTIKSRLSRGREHLRRLMEGGSAQNPVEQIAATPRHQPRRLPPAPSLTTLGPDRPVAPAASESA